MPSSVRSLLDATGLTHHGVVRWTDTIPGPAPRRPGTGIYIVSLTGDPDDDSATSADFPVSTARIEDLLSVRPELTVDRARPSAAVLIERLGQFWLPDEVVVYIGLAGPRVKPVTPSPLSFRVQEYRKTKLGARGPHAGGWPVKVLTNLDELWVHYSYVADYSTAEDELLGAFRAATSPSVRQTWPTNDVMPYANLEFPKGVRKSHGIRGAKEPRAPRSGGATVAATAPPREAPLEAPAPRPTSAHSGESETRPITESDLTAGRIRVGRGNKDSFPAERGPVQVVLAGEMLDCRWDPRFEPRERSGVLSVGKRTLSLLAAVGDDFCIRADEGGTVWLG